MSDPTIPQAPAQAVQDATDAAGVILTSTKARKIVAAGMGLYAAALSVVASGLSALILAGDANLIPAWVSPTLIVAAAVYVPVSSITHGIWKANVK